MTEAALFVLFALAWGLIGCAVTGNIVASLDRQGQLVSNAWGVSLTLLSIALGPLMLPTMICIIASEKQPK